MGIDETSSMGRSSGSLNADRELWKAEEYAKLGSGKEPRSRSALDILRTPWFVWPVFVMSILAGSSSAALTKSIHGVSPFALAFWRHQVSCIVMLPGFIWQCSRSSASDLKNYGLLSNLGLLGIASFGLAAHFATYIWSLDHTSMTHSLFLTSMSPMFVAVYTKFLGGALLKLEVVGVSLGLLGATILAAGTRVEFDTESTHLGDFVALCSAACMATYLTAGRKLRGWIPVLVYQFEVTLGAAFLLAGTSAVVEEFSWEKGEEGAPFAWIRREYILGTILLGLIPGIIGHGGYSIVIKYASPLLVPTGLSLSPILGSALGWAVGESSVPGLWTCLGGLVTLLGTLCVSFSVEHNRKMTPIQKSEQPQDGYRLPAAADEEGQQGTKPLLQPSQQP